MRLLARVLIAAAIASLPVGAALVSCGTSAIGIPACQEIEGARCEALTVATACAPAGFSVASCQSYYNEECLVGIQNPSDAGDTLLNQYTTTCANDIAALAKCVSQHTPIATCGVVLVDAGLECGDAGPEVEAGPPTECQILTVCPEQIASCNFVATPLAANGAACSEDTACESGNCLNSICCAASSCTGECLVGTCNTGTCDLQPPGFTCTDGTCTGTNGDSISGLGVCDGTTVTCHTVPGEITCTAGTCAGAGCTSCTADSQCSPYSWCSGGACMGKGLTGNPCSANNMCVNGSCNSSLCN